VGGSGVDHIAYAIDGDAQPAYSAPFTLTDDGDHIVTFQSIDKAGNPENEQTKHVKIDHTPPLVTYSGQQANYTVDETVDITCTPADDGSGVASSTCQNINGPANTFSLGEHSYSATSTDNVGNVGTGSVSFTIGVTPEGLCGLTEKEVSNSVLANVLCAPLQLLANPLVAYNPWLKTTLVNFYVVGLQTQVYLPASERAQLIKYARLL
jgi:hypothetical protein